MVQLSISDATDRSAPRPCATRPAARQRPLPDAEIVGEVVSWTFLFEMQATLHPRRVSESGRICRIVCDCACRRHQCCPIIQNKKCGTFSFYEQLLGKQSTLPIRAPYSVGELCASLSGWQSCIR